MAIHARLGRWNACERGVLDRRVAIPAIDSNSTCMMRMAELNGLVASNALLGVVRGGHETVPEIDEAADDEEGPEDADLGNRICAGMENLRHSASLTQRVTIMFR